MVIGIEIGSTRIKSVLVDENAKVIAQGCYEWENVLVDGLWSYPLEEIDFGVRESYKNLIKNYGKDVETVKAIGISGMMHGYLAFDKEDNLLVPFRTWRNTNTEKASNELSELFNFNVPMRWSISQYYQSIIDELPHVKEVAFLTTVSGYVHYKLTGKKVIGASDASGMFPLNGKEYDKIMLNKFNTLIKNKGINVNVENLLPKVLYAGENAGILTKNGAKWLDTTGKLKEGAVLCPPEGDMGTGMIATNCVLPKSANVSAGTSGNLTVVLEKPFGRYYKEIDIISTPDGYPAMLLHANNCTTEISKWVGLFGEILELFGKNVEKKELYEKLFTVSDISDEDFGKIINYNFVSGEPIAGTFNGSPLTLRTADGKLSLGNFMYSLVYSVLAPLSLGLDIVKNERVEIDNVVAHGGFYKTENIGQKATSAILNAPVTVMDNASEGGAWGIAILALYLERNDIRLGQFLDNIFANVSKKTMIAEPKDLKKCKSYLELYKKFLNVAIKTAQTKN